MFSVGSYRDKWHDMCQQKNRMQLTAEIAILKIIYDNHEIINFPENCQKLAKHLFSEHHYHLDTQPKLDYISCSYDVLDVIW